MEGTRCPKLKVAIIHPDLGIGGAERLIVDAAIELASYGHSVHVFTAHHDKKRCFEETVTGNFQVSVYGSFLPRHFFYRFHAVCAYMRCIFVALCVLLMWSSFDVVLADQVSVVVPLMKLKRSTKICYLHNARLGFIGFTANQSTYSKRRLLVFLFRLTFNGMADLILVNSRFTKSTFASTFQGLHLRGVEPAVLYPAVNVKQFGEHCSYKPNFLSINRFERKKNLQLAISSFALLSSSALNSYEVTLTIAGGFDKRLKENVEYLEELKRLAKDLGVSDRVQFITSCSTAERNTLLSSCICVLYTPKDEHFGIVPLEAMASKKPVIACNSGGPVETVSHESTGFLCDPTSSEFAKAMSKLLSDTELVMKMGKEARRHVAETFSTEIFGDRLNRYVFDAYHRGFE